MDREALQVFFSLPCHNCSVLAFCHIDHCGACYAVETEHKRAVVTFIAANINLEQIFVQMKMLSNCSSFNKQAATVIDVENEEVGPPLDYLFKDFLHGKQDGGLFLVS